MRAKITFEVTIGYTYPLRNYVGDYNSESRHIHFDHELQYDMYNMYGTSNDPVLATIVSTYVNLLDLRSKDIEATARQLYDKLTQPEEDDA